MGQLAFTLPQLGQPNNTEDPDIVNALSAIKNAINGDLDTTNLSPVADIKFSQLAADVATQLAGVIIPVASILSYAGTTAPNGFKICDGQALSRTTYSDLWNAIHATYGPGDGASTFNIPDLRARVPVGLAAGNLVHGTVGQKEGTNGPTARSSYHSHNVPTTDNTGPPSATHTLQFATGAGLPAQFVTVDHIHNYGNVLTENATPAYLTLNYIIKV